VGVEGRRSSSERCCREGDVFFLICWYTIFAWIFMKPLTRFTVMAH